jgi:hypothetical protein
LFNGHPFADIAVLVVVDVDVELAFLNSFVFFLNFIFVTVGLV